MSGSNAAPAQSRAVDDCAGDFSGVFAAIEQPPANESATYSPHCAAPWPFGLKGIGADAAASLLNASVGANTLVQLLLRDSDFFQSDVPDAPQPFSGATRDGLMRALYVCLGEVQHVAERLYDRVSEEGA